MENNIEHLIEDFTQEVYSLGTSTVARVSKVPDSGAYNHEKGNCMNLSGFLSLYGRPNQDTMRVNSMLVQSIVNVEPRLKRLEARVKKDRANLEQSRERLKNYLVFNDLVDHKKVYGRVRK